MTPDDAQRELDKIADTLAWAEQHLSRNNEANAALHCNDRVMYSPLTSRVVEARRSVEMLTAAVAEGEVQPT